MDVVLLFIIFCVGLVGFRFFVVMLGCVMRLGFVVIVCLDLGFIVVLCGVIV